MGTFLKRFGNPLVLVFKNPILFLPYIYTVSLLVFAALFSFFYSGAFNFVSSIDFSQFETQQIEVYNFFFENFLRIIISVVFFLSVLFVAGVSASAWRYSMISKIVRKREISGIFNSYREGITHFWTVVFLNVLLFLLFILVGIVSSAVLSLGFLFENVFFTAFLFLIIALFIIFFRLAILFRYPIIFMKDIGAYNSLKESTNLFLRNKWHVTKVFLCLMVIGASVTLSLVFVNALLLKILPTFLIWIELLIRGLIFIIGSLWAEIFLFKSL